MEVEKIKNVDFYSLSEKNIKLKNIDLWEKISSNKHDIDFKEKFYMYENSIIELPICECGNKLKFIDMSKGFRIFCSKRCMFDSKIIKEKKKITNKERYGVDNPSKSIEVKRKVKKTNNERYGVDFPLQSKIIKDKVKKTNNERYGVDNPSMIKEVRMKAEKTTFERYGVKNAMQNDEVKEKLKTSFFIKYGVDNPSMIKEVRMKAEKTMFERYGVNYALQNDKFLSKLKNTNKERYGEEYFTKTDEYSNIMLDIIFDKNSKMVNSYKYTLLKSNKSEYTIECNVCNNIFIIQRQLWRNRLNRNEDICLLCNPISSGVSLMELELFDFIKSNYNGIILRNDRNIIGKELDILLPDLNLAFEFNGLYWHSELFKTKSYHLDKTKSCSEFDINLIHIWEDDWLNKKNIIKSIILNKLGKSKRIFARKCIIKEINDNNLIRDFLNKNHIQGFVGSNIKLGLYYNDELISIMTFGSLRKSLGQINNNGSYELIRFCNKLNYSVVGGASKLLKYFKNNFEFNDIISYSDNSRGVGNLYKSLGFELFNDTSLNYYWCKDGIKHHRFNFRKDKLVREGFDSKKTEREIMYERGYFRIFDCGNRKWILKNI